jgi:hypothetical protein
MKVYRSQAKSKSVTEAKSSLTNPRPSPSSSKRPGFSHLDGFDPAKGVRTRTNPNDLTFHGGKVLSSPTFQPIYLGDYWRTPKGAADRAYNDAFAKDLVSGSHEAILAQYGVGKGQTAPSTVVPGSPKVVTKADVERLVKAQLASGAAANGPQTVHMVVLPPGTVLSDGSADSTQGLGGFHNSYLGADGKPVYYAVVCYSQGGNGIDFTGKGRDNVTITESHEFDEAVTDPDVGQGKLAWYNQRFGEIGDLAVNSGLVPFEKTWVRDEKGFAVQVEWSNADHAFLGVKKS